MEMKNRIRFAAAIIAACVVAPFAALAQPYPSKPIKMIVAYGPGSGADIVGRILAEQLTKQMGQTVVVENRDGAGGSIGTTLAAKSPNDGYTILMAPTTLTVSPALQATPAYDPIRDFTPITRVAIQPMSIVTSLDAPYNNLRELLAYAKANPGKLSYGTSGKGSPSHLEMEMINSLMGTKMQDVPYKSFGSAISDTISGQVSFYFPTFPAALPHIKGGKVKALAVGSTERAPQAPNIPTIAEELGKPGYEVSVWYGVVAPAGVPAEVVKRLHTEIAKALELPEVREKISNTGAVVSTAPPEKFAAQVRDETAKWGKMVRDLDLKATQ
jgi:tripartite-type tricarboxylate transporter receptor subunit TctC